MHGCMDVCMTCLCAQGLILAQDLGSRFWCGFSWSSFLCDLWPYMGAGATVVAGPPTELRCAEGLSVWMQARVRPARLSALLGWLFLPEELNEQPANPQAGFFSCSSERKFLLHIKYTVMAGDVTDGDGSSRSVPAWGDDVMAPSPGHRDLITSVWHLLLWGICNVLGGQD